MLGLIIWNEAVILGEKDYHNAKRTCVYIECDRHLSTAF